jgi:hypothetical protein
MKNDWFKSSYSNNGGECVETKSSADGGVQVKDSKDAQSPVLSFTSAEWKAFVSGVKAGEFDL